MSSTRARQIEILVEPVVDGESEGSLAFTPTTYTAKGAIEEFLQDEEIAEELKIDFKAMECNRIERFNEKHNMFVRITGSTTLEDGDYLRVILKRATTPAPATVSHEERPALDNCSNVVEPQLLPSKLRRPERLDRTTPATPVTSTREVHVTKTALVKACRENNSLLAQKALILWNRFNREVRNAVRATKWKGSAGFHRCSGTSNREALDNELTRQRLVNSEPLVSLYRKVKIPGLGVMVLDHHKAADQIRHVLAQMKKMGQLQPVKIEKQTTPPSQAGSSTIPEGPGLEQHQERSGSQHSVGSADAAPVQQREGLPSSSDSQISEDDSPFQLQPTSDEEEHSVGSADTAPVPQREWLPSSSDSQHSEDDSPIQLQSTSDEEEDLDNVDTGHGKRPRGSDEEDSDISSTGEEDHSAAKRSRHRSTTTPPSPAGPSTIPEGPGLVQHREHSGSQHSVGSADAPLVQQRERLPSSSDSQISEHDSPIQLQPTSDEEECNGKTTVFSFTTSGLYNVFPTIPTKSVGQEVFKHCRLLVTVDDGSDQFVYLDTAQQNLLYGPMIPPHRNLATIFTLKTYTEITAPAQEIDGFPYILRSVVTPSAVPTFLQHSPSEYDIKMLLVAESTPLYLVECSNSINSNSEYAIFTLDPQDSKNRIYLRPAPSFSGTRRRKIFGYMTTPNNFDSDINYVFQIAPITDLDQETFLFS